jgi:hypothetical protein
VESALPANREEGSPKCEAPSTAPYSCSPCS